MSLSCINHCLVVIKSYFVSRKLLLPWYKLFSLQYIKDIVRFTKGNLKKLKTFFFCFPLKATKARITKLQWKYVIFFVDVFTCQIVFFQETHLPQGHCHVEELCTVRAVSPSLSPSTKMRVLIIFRRLYNESLTRIMNPVRTLWIFECTG